MLRYKVKLTFTDGEKRYWPGDYWEPTGGKWENSIKQHFVYVVDEPEPEPKKKAVKRGRSSNK